MRKVGQRGQAGQMQELDRLIDLAEEVAAYEAMSDEIEAAGETLEKHRAEFEAMARNDMDVVMHTRRLFAEERFARWRFTAEDVYRAFEAVGYPPGGRIEADENAKITQAALSYLADKERRTRLARQLLMLLPEYVDAGRYIDAWLIQYSAYHMVEAPERSNPFLFMMFYHGYEEWATQIEDQQRRMMLEMGLDPDEVWAASSNIDEYVARVEAVLADPEKKARLEALYEQHGMMADQAGAEVQAWERGIMRLLDREDADRLYLTDEEMAPWLPMLEERLMPVMAEIEQARIEGRTEDHAALDALRKELAEIAREMGADVFTPERVAQLVEELRAYRRDLEALEEHQAARSAEHAIFMLEQLPDLKEEPLLIGICFASLRALLIGVAEGTRAEPE